MRPFLVLPARERTLNGPSHLLFKTPTIKCARWQRRWQSRREDRRKPIRDSAWGAPENRRHSDFRAVLAVITVDDRWPVRDHRTDGTSGTSLGAQSVADT